MSYAKYIQGLILREEGQCKANGNLPLMCRLTVDGEIKQFRCKMDVSPHLWDVKNNRISCLNYLNSTMRSLRRKSDIAVPKGHSPVIKPSANIFGSFYHIPTDVRIWRKAFAVTFDNLNIVEYR